MAEVLAICQLGGEFTTNSDGTMSYSGGDAHALSIRHGMTYNELKKEISSMFNCKADAHFMKYFLPNNKRTLISITNDKDLQRMVEFHANSDTTDIYVIKKVDSRIRPVAADICTTAEATPAPAGTVLDGSKRLKVPEEWDNIITGVGQVFEGTKDFRDALHKYAIAKRFTYRFIKNDTSRVTAECTADDCSWRIHASKSPAKKEFTVKKWNNTHTCQKDSVKSHRLASQRWVASVIKEKLRDSPNYKPRDIANDLEREYGLTLNYSQAWRGRSIAQKELFDTSAEACNQLPWFCERIMETNPGSVATVSTSEDSNFCFFVAFHASLHGFEQGCRPLLFLDGISLKPNRKLRMLAATAVDGEGYVFPVAISVVDSESQENWRWFLQQLKSALTTPRSLTFISNGKNGLWDEVGLVFEDSEHGYCINHLYEEFKMHLDDSWTAEVKNSVVNQLRGAIYACKAEEFDQCVGSIRALSEKLADWIVNTKPERWSDAFFKGSRFGKYSSNAVETLTAWTSTRYELSVVEIVDMIRCGIMEMMYMRREASNAWADSLTPSTCRKVQVEIENSHTLHDVVCTGGSVFQVQDDSSIVNLEMWECSCRKWQVSGLPCMHAVAVIERVERAVSDYCLKYFTTECYRLTYSASINPIPDVVIAGPSDSPHSAMVLPARTRRQVGRPKEKPADPRIAIKRAIRCSRCKGYGHNKATCKDVMSV